MKRPSDIRGFFGDPVITGALARGGSGYKTIILGDCPMTAFFNVVEGKLVWKPDIIEAAATLLRGGRVLILSNIGKLLEFKASDPNYMVDVQNNIDLRFSNGVGMGAERNNLSFTRQM